MASLKQRFMINNLANADNITASSQAYGSVTTAKKTGTGGATLTPSGSYTGSNNKLITLQIDAVGTGEIGSSTYRWKTSDTVSGWEATGQATATGTISLGSEGVQFAFGAYAGGADFVLNDKWQWWAYSTFTPANLFVNDRDEFWKSGTLATLISNGGFDSGTTYWGTSNCTIASVAGGQSGNCLEMTVTGGATQVAAQSVTTFIVGEKYRAIVWVKSGTSGDEAFHVSIGGVGLIINSTTTSTWTRHTGTFVATATTHNFNIVKNTATAGTMLFDTVSCYQIPSLEINLGSAVAVDTLALIDHNLSSSAIVTVAFNSSDSWSSPAASETLLNGANTDPYIEYVDYTYQYHKWFFDDIENSDGFVSVGKLYDGIYTEVSDGELYGGANYDSANTQRSIEEQNESIAGKETFRVIADRQEFPLVYTWLNSAELATLKSVWDYCRSVSTGQKTAIFVHYWYGTTSTLYYMYCVSDWSPARPRGGFSLTLNWRESVITRSI